MDWNTKCIYPLNPSNLQALMDYYFPFLPSGDTFEMYEEFSKYKLTLLEIEYAAIRILPLADSIKNLLKVELTQTALLDFAIEGILLFECTDYDATPERLEILKVIRRKMSINQSYDEILSMKDSLLHRVYWN
jgi:hypothetical protein